MKRVGITGSIGSGKSYVGTILRSLGFDVLDADARIHELYKEKVSLRRKLAQAFGEKSLVPEGVNRKFFADLIFTDDSAREKLESIVYPYLTSAVTEFFALKGAVDEENSVKFVEAALFSRTPQILEMLDEIWIVTAPEDVREKRLLHRGLSLEDARRRIAEQRGECDESKFTAKKIHVIENSGDKLALEKKIGEIL